MSEELSLTADKNDIDKTIIADIADDERSEDIKSSSSSKEENDFARPVIRNIKPRPEPNEEIDINKLIESYNPDKAVLTLKFADKVIKKQVSWETAKKISYYYTGESEVRNLIGEKVSFDNSKEKICYADDPKDYISILSHNLSLILRKSRFFENTELRLRKKYEDLSILYLAGFVNVTMYWGMANYGNSTLTELPYPILLTPLLTILVIVMFISNILSLEIMVRNVSNISSYIRSNYLRKE